MAVQKIGFVGIRSRDLKGLRRILEEGLGLRTTDASDQQVGYDLPDGTRVEGFSESEEFHSFFTTGPVVGFAVDDFDAAWLKLNDMRIEFLTDIQSNGGKKWVHFRFPDGTVAELIGPS
ncbi:VOC family protein [Mesorhizobium xinjiangense]|uniref:VOC family protein n=1 Tax=Mesorhizobium xinjiangense TaxID=2678685 RepID=UPI0012ED50C7|nr:hypothetical protein [Mesorhizobium xinjiangense]